ncbi:hypothetical protein T484DRAFT_1882685 [Baffinella frigidus]|nr:hypothetical protein T484DRAFT_1882685 [Cryptophyta sp. CCMP2293]
MSVASSRRSSVSGLEGSESGILDEPPRLDEVLRMAMGGGAQEEGEEQEQDVARSAPPQEFRWKCEFACTCTRTATWARLRKGTPKGLGCVCGACMTSTMFTAAAPAARTQTLAFHQAAAELDREEEAAANRMGAGPRLGVEYLGEFFPVATRHLIEPEDKTEGQALADGLHDYYTKSIAGRF